MALPFAAAAARLIAGPAARRSAASFRGNAMRSVLKGGNPKAKGMGNPKLVVDAGSFKLTMQSLDRDAKKIKLAARHGMRAAAEVLHSAVRENMSSTDHSKADLQRLDHPYADRHGSIRSTRLGGMKPYEIHDQDGKMLRALGVTHWQNQHGFGSSVKFNDSVAPHAKYVVNGTRLMLGRDVIGETLNESSVQSNMKKAIVNEIRKRGPKGKFAKADFTWSFK